MIYYNLTVLGLWIGRIPLPDPTCTGVPLRPRPRRPQPLRRTPYK